MQFHNTIACSYAKPMPARLRKPVHIALRAFLALLLALGLCLQPVLAAMGEAHEAVAHAASAATHAHGDVEAAGHLGDPAGSDDATLHDLMHFAHCCAQVSTVLPSALPKLAVQPLPGTLGGDVAALPLSQRPNPHDRPPITN